MGIVNVWVNIEIKKCESVDVGMRKGVKYLLCIVLEIELYWELLGYLESIELGKKFLKMFWCLENCFDDENWDLYKLSII